MPSTDLPDHLQLLTIAAHPHDVTYTLGTSAHHIERGDKVTVVSLTDGVTTHDERLEDELRKPEIERQPDILERSHGELADRKKHEMERVCGLFGITDVRVLPFADQPIEATPELHSALADIFYELRPHIVITHAPFNYPHHNMSSLWDNDHSITGQIVDATIHRVAKADSQLKHSPHHVAQIYYIGVEFGWTDIDLFVDISDQVANRIKAEALYESQGHTTQLAHKRIEAFAGYSGWWSQTGYAEPFIRAKAMTSNYLPVTENELKIAQLSGKELMDKLSQFASGTGDTEGDKG
jgi:LmbE family N-acetylglucosaminyl deacetylase